MVDMGPGAGVHGGTVVAAGTPAEVMQARKPDRQYLSGFRQIPMPPAAARQDAERDRTRGRDRATTSRRRLTIPLGTFTCVTGVSGGGKSTLIVETLWKALAAAA